MFNRFIFLLDNFSDSSTFSFGSAFNRLQIIEASIAQADPHGHHGVRGGRARSLEAIGALVLGGGRAGLQHLQSIGLH